jgi:hypothetical protein
LEARPCGIQIDLPAVTARNNSGRLPGAAGEKEVYGAGAEKWRRARSILKHGSSNLNVNLAADGLTRWPGSIQHERSCTIQSL